ncbi:unnamed protein product [Menidia menidia]|uniref:(Atlantic silverside) hypothetical protein n=1 Tax=Menidia menidia TaxID=238744 RepID=A0A8S4BJC1_9TELE|nr:unnamed protein product [Menidia menidia]
MRGCGAGARPRHWLTLLSGMLECLGFAGVVFGFASLVFVLKEEGYFGELCGSPSNSSSGLPLTACSSQDEQFSMVFTIASFLNNFLSLVNGYLFDRFGTMVTRLLGISLYTTGTLLVAFSSAGQCAHVHTPRSHSHRHTHTVLWRKDIRKTREKPPEGSKGLTFVFLYLEPLKVSPPLSRSVPTGALPGPVLLSRGRNSAPHNQHAGGAAEPPAHRCGRGVGNLFAAHRSTIITLYNGAFDSSSAVFFVIKVNLLAPFLSIKSHSLLSAALRSLF